MNRLLFRGFKTFWKTKSSIELVVVEYPSRDLYEIIAFDPVLRKHAPILYVDKHAVKYIILGEDGTNEKQSVLLDEVVTTFLFNHIILTEYLPQSGFIKIDIRPIFYSVKRFTSELELLIQRPLNLSFYPSPFQEHDRRLNTSVYELGCVRHLQLSLRDKWRLPLILVRVSKSLPLRESDAKIWACFVHNKTQEELLNSMVFALAECVPLESQQVLRSAAHSALLPQLCPFPGSQSGTATPLTLSGRSTPSASCRSSPASSRAPSPSFNMLSTCSSLQASAVGSPAGSAATGPSQQRSPTKQGLPPLTPSTLSRRSDRAEAMTTGTPPVEEQTHQHGHRRVNSLGNMWPVRLTRAALSSISASLSAPSSPQLSPRTILPSMSVVDSAEEEEAFVELGRSFGAVRNARNRRRAALNSSSRLSHECIPSLLGHPQSYRSSHSSDNIVHHASWREISGLSEWARVLLQQPARCRVSRIQITPTITDTTTDITNTTIA